MPLQPFPELDRTSPDFPTDVDAFFGEYMPEFVPDINALEVNVETKSAAAVSAASAADASRVAAQQAVTDSASQVALATTQANNASASASASAAARDSAQVAAAAAGAAAGLPSLAGNANKALAVKPDESGVVWAGVALTNSPAFTGNPTAPTPALGDNDTSIATTAFVQSAVSSAAPAPTVRTITTTGSVATTDNRAFIVLNGASAFTLSLPALASVPAGFSFNVRNIAAVGVGTVTVDPNGSELIAGRSTIQIYGGEEGFTIQSTGSAWQCIGRSKRVAMGTIVVTSVAQIDIEAPFVDAEIRGVDIEITAISTTTGASLEARFKLGGSYTSYSGYYFGAVSVLSAGNPSVNSGWNLSAATFSVSTGSGSGVAYVSGKMSITCGTSIEPSLQFMGARYDASVTRGDGLSAQWSVRNGAASPQGIRLSPASGNFSGGNIYVWGIRG